MPRSTRVCGRGVCEIGADIRGELRNGARVAGVADDALLERRVLAAQVRVGIELVQVPRGVLERKLRGVEPEELAIDHSLHEIVALEALLRRQRIGCEAFRFRARRLQPRDFLRESLPRSSPAPGRRNRAGPASTAKNGFATNASSMKRSTKRLPLGSSGRRRLAATGAGGGALAATGGRARINATSESPTTDL